MVAAQNLLLRGLESITFTIRNEFIDGELPPLENVHSYLYGPNLQSTDCLTLTVDCQLW